jgi:hypothetical protein
MRAPLFALTTALGLVAAPAVRAQGVQAECANAAIVGPMLAGGDACQKAVDVFRHMNVQLGTLVAGGNATLGQGGTLGGLGHFALEVRANAMQVGLPDVPAVGIQPGPARQSTFPVNDKWVAVPVADAAIGLFKGIPLGITSVGGVDALVSVAYLPEFDGSSVRVQTPDGHIKWGFGARLGILSESMVVPGVSVTWLRRDLPKATIAAAASGSDSILVRNYDLQTTAWRVVANKNFLMLGLAAGVGQDRYSATADAAYRLGGLVGPAQAIPVSVKPTRTNMFVDVSLNLTVLKIVGEVGRVSGGDVVTYNAFQKPANDPRYYGSVGVRLGL